MNDYDVMGFLIVLGALMVGAALLGVVVGAIGAWRLLQKFNVYFSKE